MESVTALRSRARDAVLSAGGRGFVRFLDRGDALFVCDAMRRVLSDAQRDAIHSALAAAGFLSREQDGMLYIVPSDALMAAFAAAQPDAVEVDWTQPGVEMAALADRWLRHAPAPLTDAGRALMLDTMRLIWQEKCGEHEMTALRESAARMMRAGDVSGMHESGRMLAGWIRQNGQIK